MTSQMERGCEQQEAGHPVSAQSAGTWLHMVQQQPMGKRLGGLHREPWLCKCGMWCLAELTLWRELSIPPTGLRLSQQCSNWLAEFQWQSHCVLINCRLLDLGGALGPVFCDRNTLFSSTVLSS